jgi:cell division transport system ATP-binding protein
MARQPKILIADEPTGNLDVETSQGIVRLLEEINNFGTTILVTTHDENIVNQLRKRVVTLRNGKIVGDQKSHGYYDLDGTHSKIVKRPLAASSHLATGTPQPEPQPEPEQPKESPRHQPLIIHSTSSRVRAEAPKTAEEPKRRAPKRRFIN